MNVEYVTCNKSLKSIIPDVKNFILVHRDRGRQNDPNGSMHKAPSIKTFLYFSNFAMRTNDVIMYGTLIDIRGIQYIYEKVFYGQVVDHSQEAHRQCARNKRYLDFWI